MIHKFFKNVFINYHFDWHLRGIILVLRFNQMVENLTAFLYYERNRPREKVHEVWKKIRVRTLDELLDVQGVVLSPKISTSNFITAPLLL